MTLTSAHPHTCTLHDSHTCTSSHMYSLTFTLTHDPHKCTSSHMHNLTHALLTHTLSHAHPHSCTGTTLRLLPPKLVVTEGETVTFTCTPVSPLAYPILTMNNALVITNPRLKVSKK